MVHANQAIFTGYALGRGDFSDFHYIKPSAHVGPFSTEYDAFYHAKQAEKLRERLRQMAGGGWRRHTQYIYFPTTPDRSKYVTATNTKIVRLSRKEKKRPHLEIAPPEVSATETCSTSTATKRRLLDAIDTDTTILEPDVIDREEALLLPQAKQ